MILLDTCSLIWMTLAPKELSKKAAKAIHNEALLISDISFWELKMLMKKNRLKIDSDYLTFINLILNSHDLEIQAITPEISEFAIEFDDSINNDPADRIIAATSIFRKCALVTADKNLIKSKLVNTIW